jgi:hypothetical protein
MKNRNSAIRIHILVVSIILCIISASLLNAENIEKVDYGLNYVYNYFYDCEYYNYMVDSINSTSGRIIGKNGRVMESMQITTFYRLPFINYLSFNAGLPYVLARVKWNGSLEEIKSLDLRTGAYKGDIFDITIKLKNLPELAANNKTDSILTGDIIPTIDDVYDFQPLKKYGSLKIVVTSEKEEFPMDILLLEHNLDNTNTGRRFITSRMKQVVPGKENTIIIEKIPQGTHCIDIRLNNNDYLNYLITDINITSDGELELQLHISEKKHNTDQCYLFLQWNNPEKKEIYTNIKFK